MRLVVTRPEPDAQDLARALEKHDIEALRVPLLEISHRRNVELSKGLPQAVLATSANGIRALCSYSDYAQYTSLPIYVVGDASASEARASGFDQVHSASGDLAALRALVKQNLRPEAGPLLYVTGSKIAGDLAGLLGGDGYEVIRAVLYDAIALSSLPQTLIEEVDAGQIDGVILMSPRAAKIWSARVQDASVEQDFANLRYFCLSQAVQIALQAGLKVDDDRIIIADKPTQKSLIEGVLAQKQA